MATAVKKPEAESVPANLELWSKVAKTDPAHTKKVNQRGGFTAISAHYQIMRATEVFGPVGVGWGYDTAPPTLIDGLLVVAVELWHGDRLNRFGPIYGSAELRDKNGRLDSDAPKKATTDAITKGLSHLGFNADVFLGRFDDNKYVEQMTREFAEQAANEDTPEKMPGIHKIKERLRVLQTAGGEAITLDAFNALVHGAKDDLTKIKEANHSWWTGDGEDFEGFRAWIKRRREELAEPAEDGMYAMLIASMKTCDTKPMLDNWFGTNEALIDQLDDAERRRFELAYNLHESGIQAMDRVTAGA